MRPCVLLIGLGYRFLQRIRSHLNLLKHAEGICNFSFLIGTLVQGKGKINSSTMVFISKSFLSHQLLTDICILQGVQ
jgi:hypothetical protein